MRPLVLIAAICLAGCPSGNTPEKVDAGGSNDSTTGDAGASEESSFHGRGAYDVAVEARRPVAADFDGDGNLDLAIAHQFSDAVHVFQGNGLGGFAADTPITLSRAVSSTAADFDGDDAAELVLATDESTVLVIDGLGAEDSTTELELSALPDGITTLDGDLDGSPDIAVSIAGDGANPATRVALFVSTDEGFAEPETLEVGFTPRQLLAGDVDDDGDEDLAVILGTTSALVLQSDGVGGFAASAPFDLGDGVLNAALLDADDSGGLDMVAADLTGGVLNLALDIPGEGAEKLTEVESPFDVAAANLNDDGRTDLVVTSVDSGEVRGLLSSSEGTYRPVLLAAIDDARRLGAVTTGDFDGDGLDDLAVVERGATDTNGTLHVFTSSEAPGR